MKNLKTIYKIATLTPNDQGNLERDKLYSGLYGLKIHGVSYLTKKEAIDALNTPPYEKELKAGESYTILKLYST